jgi:hypothetical protein
MKVVIIEEGIKNNPFYDEAKESLISSCLEEAKKDSNWNTSKEVTITLESFGADIDEISCDYEFTK